jgi:hypothetical protein
MAKREPLPFDQQVSFNSALFLERINVEQLESLFQLLGFTTAQARMIPFIVHQYSISTQPTETGRVVVLINPECGYDVALDIF